MINPAVTLMHGEMMAVHVEIELLKDMMVENDDTIVGFGARLAAYENHHAQLSATSLFNSARNRFRKERDSRGNSGKGSGLADVIKK